MRARQVVELIYTYFRGGPLSEASMKMSKHVSSDIVFKDPVASTRGWPAYGKVYEQFISADQLYYKILDWLCSGRTVYMNWIFGMRNEHTQNE